MTTHPTIIMQNRSFQIYSQCFTFHSVSIGLQCLLATSLTEIFIHSKIQAFIIDEICEELNDLFGVSRQLHISFLTT